MPEAAQAGCVGLPPVVVVRERTDEQAKYERMWTRPEYRQVAPGETTAQAFLQVAKPKQGASIIDFGAGTGRGALALAMFGGLKVTMLDFAENCIDDDIRPMLETQKEYLQFQQHDLTRPAPISAQYGYCTDVMEHIPPADVDRVLVNILQAAQHVFFQISCEDDKLGALIGAPLHLSVHPYEWWLQKLQSFGCVVHWSLDATTHCLFYVTAWQDGKTLVDHGTINVTEEEIRANVAENLKGDWQEVSPYLTNDFEVLILAGGPSLNDFEPTIRQMRANGAKLVTLNGTYHWALDRGLTPSAQIVVDAREFNKRFTHPVVDDCKYLIASQAHPSVLAGLPKDRTYLWHTTMEAISETITAARPAWYGVPGGSTVMLRAIPLLRMLGFRKFHLFGFDSCLRDDQHHAYAQVENDGVAVIPVTCGSRVFQCTPWMAAQAHEFMDLVRFLGDEVELEVYGDGLISHILKTGASLQDEQDDLAAAQDAADAEDRYDR